MASSATSMMLNPALLLTCRQVDVGSLAGGQLAASRGDRAGSLPDDQLLPGAGAAEVVRGGSCCQADDVELAHLAPGGRLAGSRAKDRHDFPSSLREPAPDSRIYRV